MTDKPVSAHGVRAEAAAAKGGRTALRVEKKFGLKPVVLPTAEEGQVGRYAGFPAGGGGAFKERRSCRHGAGERPGAAAGAAAGDRAGRGGGISGAGVQEGALRGDAHVPCGGGLVVVVR